MNQLADEDHIYFVCKYCGRSSTNKEVIQIHEYEFHIKTAKDLRRLKPNPSFMVKKTPKREYNQYKLENSYMNSNGSVSLFSITAKQEQKNFINRELLNFQIEDSQITTEMAQSLRKCFKDCIISTAKSKIMGSSTKATMKMGTKVISNTSQSQFRSNVKIIKTETHQSSSSSEILIKMNPIPEEKDDDEENEEEEGNMNLQAKSVKPIVKQFKKRTKKSNKSAKCKICHKVFAHSTYLYVHNRVHQNLKKFKCSICPFSSCYPTALNRHLQIHAKENPFGCRFCPMKFAQAGPRQHHERSQHATQPHSKL